jgi:cyclopropane-fatty-acyl-phospholipid synthase
MSLADAQRAKFELVCTKLELQPGMRMLDVGCGWGSLSIHAARRHGVHVTGITLSREQLDFGRKRAADLGVGDLVDFRLLDYRDLREHDFDAAASLEMGEHVGAEQYPVFVDTVRRALAPGAPFLVQAGDNAFAEGAWAPLRALIDDPQVDDAYQRIAEWNFSTPTGIREGYDPGDNPSALPEPSQQQIELVA